MLSARLRSLLGMSSILLFLLYLLRRFLKKNNNKIASDKNDNENENDEKRMRITHLAVYPVKSCAGIMVKEAELTPLGFANDRLWCIIREANNRFVTQREFPQLALVQPEVLVLEEEEKGKREVILVLSERKKEGVKFPFKTPARIEVKLNLGGERKSVVVWKDTVGEVVDQGDEVAAWISDKINNASAVERESENFRLVYFGPESKRIVNVDYALVPGKDVVSFADAYPVLLTSESSLNDLNERIARKGHGKVIMRQFRPNLVVAGGAANIPWAEDTWHSEMSIRSCTEPSKIIIKFRLVKPCDRCKLTTVDPDKGEFDLAHNEPLTTLHEFRTLPEFKPHMVFFGQNTIFIDLDKYKEKVILRVGDFIEFE